MELNCGLWLAESWTVRQRASWGKNESIYHEESDFRWGPLEWNRWTIFSIIISHTQSFFANRSAEMERHSCRWWRWWEICFLQRFEDNSSRNVRRNGTEHVVSNVLSQSQGTFLMDGWNVDGPFASDLRHGKISVFFLNFSISFIRKRKQTVQQWPIFKKMNHTTWWYHEKHHTSVKSTRNKYIWSVSKAPKIKEWHHGKPNPMKLFFMTLYQPIGLTGWSTPKLKRYVPNHHVRHPKFFRLNSGIFNAVSNYSVVWLLNPSCGTSRSRARWRKIWINVLFFSKIWGRSTRTTHSLMQYLERYKISSGPKCSCCSKYWAEGVVLHVWDFSILSEHTRRLTKDRKDDVVGHAMVTLMVSWNTIK